MKMRKLLGRGNREEDEGGEVGMGRRRESLTGEERGTGKMTFD